MNDADLKPWRRADNARSVVRAVFVCLLMALAVFTPHAQAHDARPAYLQITETAPARYSVLWRIPVLSGNQLPVALKLPESAKTIGDPILQRLNDSLVERRVVETGKEGFAGQRIDFIGLQATITDVLVRVKYLNGEQVTVLVQPSKAWIAVPAKQGFLGVLSTYVHHGVEHILLGYDHLLFVLALILIVRSARTLLWTITAFTLAHSITLALASLGIVHVPIPPVEAAIALSIVLLAMEILRLRRGEPSVTARWPWMVAFAFGLLHGFGFASALTEIGLPSHDLPLALFAFNVGVELGQLAFIAVVLSLWAVLRRIPFSPWVRDYAPVASAYAIGIMATFWFLERVSGF